MIIETQFAVGLTAGIAAGLGIVAFRPLAVAIPLAAAGGVIYLLYESSVSGLAAALEGAGIQIMAAAPFCLAAAIGTVITASLATRN